MMRWRRDFFVVLELNVEKKNTKKIASILCDGGVSKVTQIIMCITHSSLT